MQERVAVVCGATGNQGRAVVDALLRRGGWTVVGLSRDPGGAAAQALKGRGVEVRAGDLQDPASLVRAFAGADAVFGLTQPWSADYRSADPAAEVEQGRNLAWAGKEAGVGHLVLSTVLQVHEQRTGIPHVDSKVSVEEAARDSGIPFTILGPGSFMDNIGMAFFPVKKGSVRGFTDADARIPYIACRDIGEAAAAVMTDRGSWSGRRVNLIGALVSGQELCDSLGRLRGERFRYKVIPRLLMRLFAREFYLMRLAFEKQGRPPYPDAYTRALEETRALVPDAWSIDAFLRARGFDTRAL